LYLKSVSSFDLELADSLFDNSSDNNWLQKRSYLWCSTKLKR